MSWPGWEDFTPPSTSDPLRQSKRSKYGAVKTDVDGITFDSKREAERYVALKDEQARGVISGLELQPQFPLHVTTPQGARVVIGRYIADFRYVISNCEVIEDAKGFRGKELYLWKRKHVEAEYGIEIREV